MLTKVKMALRISVNSYDNELDQLIDAAILDLGIAGVDLPTTIDALCERAIITYCKCNFGVPDNYDKLKASYDEQKAQLRVSSNYTDWGVA